MLFLTDFVWEIKIWLKIFKYRLDGLWCCKFDIPDMNCNFLMFNVVNAHCITINKLNIKSKLLNDVSLLEWCAFIITLILGH